MAEQEPHPVDALRQRAVMGERLDYLKGDTSTPSGRFFLRDFHNVQTRTRSETPISFAASALFDRKVSKISEWVRQEGYSGKDHPDYEELIEDDRTPAEMANMHWYERAGYSVSTWQTDTEDDERVRIMHPQLDLLVTDPDAQATIDFDYGHSRYFTLRVGFIPRDNDQGFEAEPSNFLLDLLKGTSQEAEMRRIIQSYGLDPVADSRPPQDPYYVGPMHVTKMSDEEHAVVTFYLNKFMTDRNIT